ncbi:hypothetical protein [Mucilaginibacter sp. OK283]|jgi:hypothetical protein|uniref:hypothetical protein n=1 Tax=Mucilaginibacter sp. OK283 TaxID=1881049 RepID=UPI0008D813CA|nr:hypothetical protein [Mucilaginibacter sp. OK283]SEO36685.1 hypothetical protein SAMN05428947_102122 [Mucilaginibacter sp. OK283]
MGIFFKQSANVGANTEVGDSAEIIDQQSSEVVADTNTTLIWGRLIFAIVLLLVILFTGLYAGQKKPLEEWSKVLIHSFELLLGAFIGIITGESASKKND